MSEDAKKIQQMDLDSLVQFIEQSSSKNSGAKKGGPKAGNAAAPIVKQKK